MAQQQTSGVLKILQDALEAQPEPHPALLKFDQLIDKDFIDLSRRETGCDNLNAYIGLQHIKQRLQEIANFPEINSKTVIAVGGGFSAGKSSFINSLLDPEGANKVRLATGNRPVTAVPSYLVHSSELNKISGINYKNARFDIAPSDYEELKHDSAQIGTFRVSSAIKYCAVKLKFKTDLLEHCCLIDIPGYNPGTNTQDQDDIDSDLDTGDTIDLSFLYDDDDDQSIYEPNASDIEAPSTDYNIARDAIAKADCLIWLFSLEHGPLPGNDLEFLRKVCNGKPLYLVGNKSDLRTVNDVKDCLVQTSKTLSDAGIEYAGICAYNSRLGKVSLRQINDNQSDVLEFIRNHNNEKNIAEQINKLLQPIFNIYFKKISDEADFTKGILKHIEQIERQGIQDGLFRTVRRYPVQDKINDLKDTFYTRRKGSADLNKIAHDVCDKFIECIQEFCLSLDLPLVPVNKPKFCVLCGTEIYCDRTSCQPCIDRKNVEIFKNS